ncbi:hypothetical protein [Ascidiimonas sp. W6]|uniref:hypothetical protein n=1 Tax=Ascidiimonas meishanensis TaxID=3128903 RepID=UPI0030EC87DF
MKKNAKLIIIIIFSLVLFASCTNQDDGYTSYASEQIATDPPSDPEPIEDEDEDLDPNGIVIKVCEFQ